jgi:osmoprotectant transport system permease protein
MTFLDPQFVVRCLEHLVLVFAALALTIVVGAPLGVCAYFYKSARKAILLVVEILQTVPAMALLGIIMIFMGAGKPTVILGLLLYSLLPIVQNTYVGLSEVDPAIKEAANGMGMTRLYKLVHVELPIAFPLIFAGIRIAAVTAVGIATFAALVGGGGLGVLIFRGIRTSNMDLILTSTAALMLMALAFNFGMTAVEKFLQRRACAQKTEKDAQ